MSNETPTYRCPNCDSVVQKGSKRCLMCGHTLPAELFAPPRPVSTPAVEPPPPPPAPEPIKTAVPLEERIQKMPAAVPVQNPQPPGWQPTPLFALVVLALVGLSICGGFWLNQADQATAAVGQITPTFTTTPTFTPSSTPSPEVSSTPTLTPSPTITFTPLPTDTPQPPRFYTVQSGDTVIGIALLYRITVQSIAEANALNPDNPIIQEGQAVQIPWPTPTPPLESFLLTVGETNYVIDPAGCPPFYEIQEGDTLFPIAANNGVPLDGLLQVNRLTIDSLLKPGDTICIPQVREGETLPPTPGPSPTPSMTPPPAGAQLLYPPLGIKINDPFQTVALQWLAVEDLAPEEYYMVEITNMRLVDMHPYRGFTRANSFQIPAEWRPAVSEQHEYRWRVSLVKVTGQRADGTFIYTYAGQTSPSWYFYWQGIEPSPTPTPTFTPTPTPPPTATPSE